MRSFLFNNCRSTATLRRSEHGSARTILLVVACLLIGAGVGAFWFSQRASHNSAGAKPDADGQGTAELSDATRSMLQQLRSPVEVRFYSVLDPASVSPAVRAYAGRVQRLVELYEQASGGQIKLTHFDAVSGSGADSAHADGVKAFNLDKGDACYLGIAVAQDNRKEALPYLAPEWEPALESDLTRAIARVSQPTPEQSAAVPARPDAATIESVKQTVPNLDSVTLEEGTKLLREAALKEFKTTAQELQTKINDAQQKVLQAQNSPSEADRQAALKQLQDLQAQQSEKLKQIAASAKAQMDALQQLKTPLK